MPCRDGGPTDSEIASDLRREVRFLEATLCGILSAGFDHAVEHVDWHEAGVTKAEVLRWFQRHKKKDEERRKRELRAKIAQRDLLIEQRENIDREIEKLDKELK